jgi:hypothetical protein
VQYFVLELQLLFLQFRDSSLVRGWSVFFAVDGIIKTGVSALQLVNPWLGSHVKILLIKLGRHKFAKQR